MINILYYSPQTILPALLASISHCHPGLTPEQARDRAEKWLQANDRSAGAPIFLKRFAGSPEGNAVWVMTAGVPLPLLKRTLGSFVALLPGRKGTAWVLQEGPLPPLTGGGKAGILKINACWRELGVVVEQTRLKEALVQQK